MAGMVDDEARFQGEVGMWNASVEGCPIAHNVEKRMGWRGGETRVGSVGKAIQTMGMARVSPPSFRAKGLVLTLCPQATYEAVLAARPNHRPVIVSRSGVPGIQAYAHGSWSGDNSTTWKALKFGTKMTLSVGLSFGPGLYGHDIVQLSSPLSARARLTICLVQGGFAGKHHPSPELLVRWCQNVRTIHHSRFAVGLLTPRSLTSQGAWHSRFTVHSWKEISTTMWMYNDVPGVSEILRDVLSFRYRLAPTFYSLFVTHYQRRGWPLLKVPSFVSPRFFA
jgi:alpha-glucosidase